MDFKIFLECLSENELEKLIDAIRDKGEMINKNIIPIYEGMKIKHFLEDHGWELSNTLYRQMSSNLDPDMFIEKLNSQMIIRLRGVGIASLLRLKNLLDRERIETKIKL